jgi:PIN domain nuclease of toxin-antitoxin system
LKLILDTHLLLWWLLDSPLLSAAARQWIADPDNTVFVSAVSLWEVWLKVSLGKLRLPENFEARLAAEGFVDLPLTATQTRELASLPWRHRDPFDRMLVAQARTEKLTLLTADDIVASYGDHVHLVPRGAINVN